MLSGIKYIYEYIYIYIYIYCYICISSYLHNIQLEVHSAKDMYMRKLIYKSNMYKHIIDF